MAAEKLGSAVLEISGDTSELEAGLERVHDLLERINGLEEGPNRRSDSSAWRHDRVLGRSSTLG
jgi:hypothetical protein